MYTYARAKHPTLIDRPLIDYLAVLLLEPLMLAGTVVGVLLNSVFPSWLLVALLAVILSYTTFRTTRKVV